MKISDDEIQARIRTETNARMRDHNKKMAEKQVAEAVAHLKRAYTLYTMAECPMFADMAIQTAKYLQRDTV